MALHHMLRAAAGNSAGPSDPYFYDVSLLLTGNGTNGAQNNTFIDSSTNNFTITRNGNTTQGTFSPYGSLWSNYFDGSGDYLSAANNSAFSLASSAFTVEAWVYFNEVTAQRCVISTYLNSSSGWTIQLNGGVLNWNGSGDGLDISGTTSIKAGTWYHVAVSGTAGTSTKLFINGVQEGSAYAGNIVDSSSTLYIGQIAGAGYMNGYISNVRVVKGTALYTSNFTPSTAPLTAVSGTSLLTCQSNRFIDNSSNNFTLTVNGNTSVQRFSPFNPTAPYSASTIGGSGYFDGTGDYLSIANNSTFLPAGDFTIECYAYLNNLTSYRRLITSGNNGGSGNWGLTVLTDGTVTFYINSNTSSSTTSTTALLNSWNHIVVSRQSGTLRVFINGVVGFSGTNTASLNNGASVNLVVGADSAGTDGLVNGYISSARIVNGSALYTSNFTPPTAPLTPITNTALLCNFTNAGIPDAAMMNDLETVGNAQVSTSVKKYGTGSLAFDGTGDYLKMPISPNLLFNTGDFTVEGWVYSTSGSASQFIWATHNAGTVSGWYVMLLSGKLTWGTYGNGSNGDFSSSSSYPVNQWFHAAVTKNNGTLRVFINGNQEYSGSDSANNYATAPYPFTVGADQDGTSPLFGYIDDLRITKGYARYTANFTPPAQALPTY